MNDENKEQKTVIPSILGNDEEFLHYVWGWGSWDILTQQSSVKNKDYLTRDKRLELVKV